MKFEIDNNIEIIDLALYLKKEKILILADFHLGYEEALNKQGILIPRFQFKEILQRLENIFKKVKPRLIIINGDLKHEFGTISDQEWRLTLRLLDYLTKIAPVKLIKGNHDTILGPIAEKRDVKVIPYYEINNVAILHGNKLIKTKAKILIIAHEHPAITLRRIRSEKYKCFLKGKYKNKTLIVQPSFNLVVEGTDILKEKLLSPYLKDIDDFEIFIVEDKIYYFGKVKDIRNLK